LTRDGRLTEAGFHELEAVGHMRLREARLQHWTVDNIATLLSGVGDLYVVVIGERNAQGNRMSHVVVIYGATSERILVMDPLPGRGLVEFPAGNFVNVGAGVSIIVGTYVNPS